MTARIRLEDVELSSGPNSKASPERFAEICAAIAEGMSMEIAAARAGINPSTLREWLQRAQERESEGWGKFWDMVTAAVAMAEEDNLLAIREARDGTGRFKNEKPQWTAGAWWLERMFPQKYGKFNRGTGTIATPVTNFTLNVIGPVDVDKLKKAQPIEVASEVVETKQIEKVSNG